MVVPEFATASASLSLAVAIGTILKGHLDTSVNGGGVAEGDIKSEEDTGAGTATGDGNGTGNGTGTGKTGIFSNIFGKTKNKPENSETNFFTYLQGLKEGFPSPYSVVTVTAFTYLKGLKEGFPSPYSAVTVKAFTYLKGLKEGFPSPYSVVARGGGIKRSKKIKSHSCIRRSVKRRFGRKRVMQSRMA